MPAASARPERPEAQSQGAWIKSSPPLILKRFLACAWLAAALIYLWIGFQWRVGAMPPSFRPLALLLALLLFSLAGVIWTGIRDLMRARRLVSLGMLVAGILPALVVYAPLEYARRAWDRREVPRNWATVYSKVFGAALMAGIAPMMYPHRRESRGLIMCYRNLARPDADLYAMQAHVDRLANMLGGRLRRKIVWVRGPLLGQHGVSFLGLSLGSSAGEPEDSALDRHELAHAVIEQFTHPEVDPPAILIEGWAVAQEGGERPIPELDALLFHRSGSGPSLSQAFSREWYYRSRWEIYRLGGAFARFLLKRYGPRTFLDVYRRTRPDTFARNCPLIIGPTFEELERDFWKYVDNSVKEDHDGHRLQPGT